MQFAFVYLIGNAYTTPKSYDWTLCGANPTLAPVTTAAAATGTTTGGSGGNSTTGGSLTTGGTAPTNPLGSFLFTTLRVVLINKQTPQKTAWQRA